MTLHREYWFPAKRYGWGWGFPSVWQGWVVLIAFIILAVAGAIVLFPGSRMVFVIYTLALSGVLVAICWLKGEPPRWRWGGK